MCILCVVHVAAVPVQLPMKLIILAACLLTVVMLFFFIFGPWLPRDYRDANNVLHWLFLPLMFGFVYYSVVIAAYYVVRGLVVGTSKLGALLLGPDRAIQRQR